MTSRKPPAEDQDIIEGVAVEKQDGGKASGRGGSRRRAARKGAPEPKPESSSESSSESASAEASGTTGTHGRDNARAQATTSRMPMRGGTTIALLLGLGNAPSGRIPTSSGREITKRNTNGTTTQRVKKPNTVKPMRQSKFSIN